MKHILSALLIALTLLTLCPCALAASSTPTPPPVAIQESPAVPPQIIRDALDVAYTEWETLAGKTLARVNKYTEWRGKGVGFGWCAGYITWCMMEAGVPMYEMEHFLDESNDTKEGFYPVEGVMHVQEAGVGKLLRAYQRMNRTTMVPQPGYILVYGCSYNKTIHVGLVYDVIALGGGRYRITTLEGNMSNRVKMYIRDYDMNAQVNTNNRKSTNLFEIPEDERTLPESTYVDYSVVSAKPSSSASNKYMYYVHCFLMPWVPGYPALPEVPSVPAAEPPAPTVEVTATPAPTEVPATPAPEETIATPVPTEVPVTPTPAPESDLPDAPAEEPAASAPAYPCTGRDGKCPYVTRAAADPFCRACDRNENGVEDSLE